MGNGGVFGKKMYDVEMGTVEVTVYSRDYLGWKDH